MSEKVLSKMSVSVADLFWDNSQLVDYVSQLFSQITIKFIIEKLIQEIFSKM